MASKEETNARNRHNELVRPLEILPGGDAAGICAAIVAGGIVYAVYLLTHDFPAYGAGMYMQIAKQIRLGGFEPPARILHYTANGSPFAYPPLLFYVAAAVRAVTGVDPITYTRYLPGLVVLAYAVPYYYLSKEFLGSAAKASVAAIVFTVAPPVLTWHLSAGGIVRAPAFLLSLAGIYGGVRMFRAGDRRWLVPSAVLFGLTVLSHPTYAVFFGASFLLVYASYDRSVRGLVDGASVALGGLLVAAPWVGWVGATHGLDIFGATAGTHSGLWGGTSRLYGQFVHPLVTLDGSTPFYAAAFAGGLYAIFRRRYFLPTWLFLSAQLLAESRFLFVAGAMLVSSLLFDIADARVRPAFTGKRRALVIATLCVTLVSAVTLGAVFSAGAAWNVDGRQTQPTFIDDADVQAMEWAQDNTDSSAEFVVAGDAAEWFPYFTDRTILVGPWGAEWNGQDAYRDQISSFVSISNCDSSLCVTDRLNDADATPDYVYLSKDSYTVRGWTATPSESLRTSMVADGNYELTYENEGVMVFRVGNIYADRSTDGFR